MTFEASVEKIMWPCFGKGRQSPHHTSPWAAGGAWTLPEKASMKFDVMVGLSQRSSTAQFGSKPGQIIFLPSGTRPLQEKSAAVAGTANAPTSAMEANTVRAFIAAPPVASDRSDYAMERVRQAS